MPCFELGDVGSIPARPAILPVVQWTEQLPPKKWMQVRFLPGRPITGASRETASVC
jgi:hypothetical protein